MLKFNLQKIKPLFFFYKLVNSELDKETYQLESILTTFHEQRSRLSYYWLTRQEFNVIRCSFEVKLHFLHKAMRKTSSSDSPF